MAQLELQATRECDDLLGEVTERLGTIQDVNVMGKLVGGVSIAVMSCGTQVEITLNLELFTVPRFIRGPLPGCASLEDDVVSFTYLMIVGELSSWNHYVGKFRFFLRKV
jgi:hypothetical protein